MKIHVTKPELDTILAALRYWQRLVRTHAPLPQAVKDIATDLNDHHMLKDEEIEALCQRIND
jgi:hypothetical protein